MAVYVRAMLHDAGDEESREELQCDDGNTISGDGCSASCNIEENWSCKGGSEISPDICFSNIPLTMELAEDYTQLYVFELRFNKALLNSSVEPLGKTLTVKLTRLNSTTYRYNLTALDN